MGLLDAVTRRLPRKAAPPEPKALPSTVPAPAGPRRGLAMLAADAARDGISTGTTFRVEAAEDDDEEVEVPADAGSRDRVIGVTYDAEIRVAADGTPFWGPVDNESSRARAAGRHLEVDAEECIACGTCVEHIDAVFELKNGEKARAYRQEGAMDRIQGAIDACPVTCIAWHDRR